MHPAATLFFDVCVQQDLWPEGAWPLIGAVQAENVARLSRLAADFAVRQGGAVCIHDPDGARAPEGVPAHCETLATAQHPEGCDPAYPIQIWRAGPRSSEPLGREHAMYVDSGCSLPPDHDPGHTRIFRHVTAGVRDAVVFGAGVEHGIDHAVDAFLRHRIRTHVVLDAMGSGDEALAQTIVAGWKRRGVDGLTVDVVARLLSLTL